MGPTAEVEAFEVATTKVAGARAPSGSAAWLLLPTLAVTAAYWGVQEFEFVFDDSGIETSTALREGDWFAMAFGGYQSLSNRPLTCLTLVMDQALGCGSGGMHVSNVVLHLITTLLVATLVRAVTGLGWLPAAVGATLWAVHPLHADAVAYVTQRSMLLMGLFGVLAGLALWRSHGAAKPGRWWLLCAVATALAMASKEECAALPILFLLASRAFFADSWRDLASRWPLFIGLASTWIVLLACVHWGPTNPTVGYATVPPATAWEWLLTQTQAVSHYARSTVFPNDLRIIYDFAVVRDLSPVLGRGVVIAAALFGTAWLWLRRPRIGFVGAWFFLLLAPTSSIYPILTEPCADRRMYLPLLAAVVPLTWLAHAHLRPRTFGALATVLIGVLIWQSRTATAPYRDNDSLYRHAAATNELTNGSFMSGRILAAVARVSYRHGDFATADDFIRRAMRCVAPGEHARLGEALMTERNGDPATAERLYRGILTDYPDMVDALNNLGRLLRTRAMALPAEARQALLAEAVRLLSHAVKLEPLHAGLQNTHGVALFASGRYDEAIRAFKRALELEPGLPDARRNLGLAYRTTERPTEALRLFEGLLRENPNDPIRPAAEAIRADLGRR